MAWFKDAAAGIGLVLFFVSSFVQTGAARAFLVNEASVDEAGSRVGRRLRGSETGLGTIRIE